MYLMFIIQWCDYFRTMALTKGAKRVGPSGFFYHRYHCFYWFEIMICILYLNTILLYFITTLLPLKSHLWRGGTVVLLILSLGKGHTVQSVGSGISGSGGSFSNLGLAIHFVGKVCRAEQRRGVSPNSLSPSWRCVRAELEPTHGGLIINIQRCGARSHPN